MYGTNSPYSLGDSIFDSASQFSETTLKNKEYDIPEHILDAASNDFGEKVVRANAMAAALAWLEGSDFDYASLESIVAGLSDIDDDGEITEPEEELFNEILSKCAEAFVELGGNNVNVQSFIDEESESAGEKLAAYLIKKLEDNDKSDDELVSEYAVKDKLILDASEKVVRDGKVVIKKKRLKPKKMSSKQKQALKKARRKANNAGARRKRAKSMKIRANRGL